MLKRLTIQNYALIENLDIEFPQGLVIITGETGAGKSIMLGALSLLLGGKGDVRIIRPRRAEKKLTVMIDGKHYSFLPSPKRSRLYGSTVAVMVRVAVLLFASKSPTVTRPV